MTRCRKWLSGAADDDVGSHITGQATSRGVHTVQQITKRFMNWASILEDQTRAQVQRTSRMPFIYSHIALMPDAHLGKGCAVGAVLPTLGVIMPAAVGVDIGCGMIAVRSQFTAADVPADRKPLRQAIEAESAAFDPASYARNWRPQLGTLGSGNHWR